MWSRGVILALFDRPTLGVGAHIYSKRGVALGEDFARLGEDSTC
jgi:hypothetical protein